MSLKLAFCMLLAAACIVAAAFTAKLDRGTINVGETAVVSLSGGQLDVAGGNVIGSLGDEFAQAVQITKLGKNRFQVKGKAACNCVLKFSDGKNETTIRIKVVKE